MHHPTDSDFYGHWEKWMEPWDDYQHPIIRHALSV